MSPIEAFPFTELCIALKDMNALRQVANIVNGWDWVKKYIDWCIPVL